MFVDFCKNSNYLSKNWVNILISFVKKSCHLLNTAKLGARSHPFHFLFGRLGIDIPIFLRFKWTYSLDSAGNYGRQRKN